MTTPLSPIVTSRLEKAAIDNGFDQDLPPDGNWIAFASTQCPLKIWLGAYGDTFFLAGFSQQNVLQALGDYGVKMTGPLPSGACGGRTVTTIPDMHGLLRRAYQLSRALPNELLQTFEKKTGALPRATEAERLVVQRVGQDLFRQALLDLWEGRCAVTGLAVPELLRASHIKPWADCSTDAERLDVYNGLLLAPQLDAAFDRGYITVDDEGLVVVSPVLDGAARRVLGLGHPLRVKVLADGHRAYLPWHRERVFIGIEGE